MRNDVLLLSMFPNSSKHKKNWSKKFSQDNATDTHLLYIK